MGHEINLTNWNQHFKNEKKDEMMCNGIANNGALRRARGRIFHETRVLVVIKWLNSRL